MDIKLDNKPHVVGIGASAGGLEALSQFVAGLLPDLGCIYVVAQHMSPTHRSLMAEILSRETRLPVQELTDGELPMPDVIYIIPPGYNLVFKADRFLLSTPSPEVAPKPSVNLLFQSMAEEFEERAVGIILSGTGSDGTRGLRAIKSAGGITFVQVPETAKYDGMPRSAIDACVADRIVSPDQIGRELERLVRFPGTLPDLNSGEQRSAELSDLFERVRQRTKIDFSSYKIATVQRRLQRRMVATETGTLAEYLSRTERHPEELDALAKETLISVTEFFRDKDAFRTLERFAREIVARKLPGEEIRVWVVGCATGEEAYSLAIVFSELIAEKSASGRLQVFATDIDNNALSVARRGIYNQTAMAEMAPEYVAKYFVSSGNGFEPTKELRDLVTFARQDITRRSAVPAPRSRDVPQRHDLFQHRPSGQGPVHPALFAARRGLAVPRAVRNRKPAGSPVLLGRPPRPHFSAARPEPPDQHRQAGPGAAQGSRRPSTKAPTGRASAFSCMPSPTISARRC